MDVRLHQPRHRGTAVQIDDSYSRARLGPRPAHRYEPAVSNGHRIGHGIGRVQGMNFAVDQRESDLILGHRRGVLAG